MTRSEALYIAIEVIKKSDLSPDISKEAIHALELCIKSVSSKKWTEEAIFAACNKMVAEKGQLLTSHFGTDGMPSCPVIRNTFKMSAMAFRDKYYPINSDVDTRSPYTTKTKQEWTADFISEYNRIKPKSQDEFNRKRPKEFPTWVTIAHMNNVSNWSDLLDLLHLERPNRITSFTVSSTSRSAEELKKIRQKNKG